MPGIYSIDVGHYLLINEFLKTKDMKKIYILAIAFIIGTSFFYGQEQEAAQKSGPSDEELAKSNNPLADLIAFNIQYYFRPSLNKVEGGSAHTTWFRFAIPTGRVLWRLSAPLESRAVVNQDTNFSESGLGDLDLFAAYIIKQDPKLTFGLGPSFSFDTASSDALGTGKNTAGLAAIVFAVPNPQFQGGALVIWRTDVGGDEARADVNLLAIQPFYFWQLGKGLYFRGAPIIPFDLETGDYHVPLGLGLGKVVKIEGVVCNFFMEAQPSVLSRGTGQPNYQIYGALNMQF